MRIIPKKQAGGEVYQIVGDEPEITKRYITLINNGIPAQAAFDTAHLSIIENGKPGKYYSFGKYANTLNQWGKNASNSLTVGRYNNLLNVKNHQEFKTGLKKKKYNPRDAFYNVEISRGRDVDKKRVNKWNQEHGLPLVVMNDISSPIILDQYNS